MKLWRFSRIRSRDAWWIGITVAVGIVSGVMNVAISSIAGVGSAALIFILVGSAINPTDDEIEHKFRDREDGA